MLMALTGPGRNVNERNWTHRGDRKAGFSFQSYITTIWGAFVSCRCHGCHPQLQSIIESESLDEVWASVYIQSFPGWFWWTVSVTTHCRGAQQLWNLEWIMHLEKWHSNYSPMQGKEITVLSSPKSLWLLVPTNQGPVVPWSQQNSNFVLAIPQALSYWYNLPKARMFHR